MFSPSYLEQHLATQHLFTIIFHEAANIFQAIFYLVNIQKETNKKQEMPHILTPAVEQIIHAFALASKNSQILMFSRINFQKRREFGYYFRFPSFCFLEEKPLDFTCASL